MPRLTKAEQSRRKATERKAASRMRKREEGLMILKYEVDPNVDIMIGTVARHLGRTRSQVIRDLIAECPHIPRLRYETEDVNLIRTEIEVDRFDRTYLEASPTLTVGDVVEHLFLAQCQVPTDSTIHKNDNLGRPILRYHQRYRTLLYAHPGVEGVYLTSLSVVVLEKEARSKYQVREEARRTRSTRVSIVEMHREEREARALIAAQKAGDASLEKEAARLQRERDAPALKGLQEEMRYESLSASRAHMPHATRRSTAWRRGESDEDYEAQDEG